MTLVDGARREALPVDRLYAGAAPTRTGRTDRHCDCEALFDRAYFLPLGDPSWPDDTLVEFEYMGELVKAVLAACALLGGCAMRRRRSRRAPPGPGEVRSAHAAEDRVGKSTKADVRAALGEAVVVDFESGYEVWVYRQRPPEKEPAAKAELVLLFAPSGILAKTRVR